MFLEVDELRMVKTGVSRLILLTIWLVVRNEGSGVKFLRGRLMHYATTIPGETACITEHPGLSQDALLSAIPYAEVHFLPTTRQLCAWRRPPRAASVSVQVAGPVRPLLADGGSG